MLTAKQERFCQNLEVKRMSQRAAYFDAYPKSKNWTKKAVDERACVLANSQKVLERRKELRAEQAAEARAEAAWTRSEACNELKRLIDRANTEMDVKGEMSSPNVSAIINAVKELNTIFAVAEKTNGDGVLEDILAAVRSVSND